MSRFPPIPAAELQSEQKEIYHELKAIAEEMFGGKNFTYIRSDGAFVGPFAALLYTPKSVAVHYLKLAGALGKIPGLTPAARETAILATGEQFGSAYETYAHKNIAVTTGALSETQADEISAGKKPKDSDPGMSVAWDVAKALSTTKGPLEAKLFEEAKRCFGLEGTAALIHYVGCYAYTSMLLNGADTPIPQ